MDEQKGLLTHLGEVLDRYHAKRRAEAQEFVPARYRGWLHWLGRQLVPNIGTLLMVVVLLLTVPSLAAPLHAPAATSTSTISYQGRLADSSGNPLTGKYNLEFRIYTAPTGGTPLWTEMWTGGNAVDVSDGLFNVMLGSINTALASAIQGRNELYLGITVGTDSEMSPRVQLGSVPFSMQAMTVPDGSITTAKIADGAVTGAKLNTVNGLAVSGNMTVTGHLTARALSMVSTGGIGGLRVTDTMAGGGQWTIYTGDNGCFGGSLGIGPTVPVGSGQCGGDLGTAMIVGQNGNVHVVGSFTAGGTKSAFVDTDHFGKRRLYAVESPEVLFSDEGLARLKDGIARVNLDPIFLDTIEGEYLVHVTPYGDASLYVAQVGRGYFVVKARGDDPDVAFSWRLSAHRKGYAGIRLEEVGE